MSIMKTIIRDACPSDAQFLAQCILAGMHFYDFNNPNNGEVPGIMDSLIRCELREDTLYSYTRTRVAEVDGQAAGSLLAYPGDLQSKLRNSMFKEFWPDIYLKYKDEVFECEPGDFYLDSLAVNPAFRHQGIGRALMEDGIQKGISLGYKKVTLLVDDQYPLLIKLYESIGFKIESQRKVLGVNFLRMVYSI